MHLRDTQAETQQSALGSHILRVFIVDWNLELTHATCSESFLKLIFSNWEASDCMIRGSKMKRIVLRQVHLHLEWPGTMHLGLT